MATKETLDNTALADSKAKNGKAPNGANGDYTAESIKDTGMEISESRWLAGGAAASLPQPLPA